jgi:hypothetical protein
LQVSSVFALALLALLSIQGISGATGKALVNYSLAKLPTGEENFTINSSQVISSPLQLQAISNYLGKKLVGITSGALVPEIIYSELVDTHGVRFFYGAVDRLAGEVSLSSGRLPSACDPGACEVLQIGGDPKVAPRPSALGITVVGYGQITNKKIFAGTMGPPAGTALLLGNGIESASQLASLERSHGSNGWVANLDLKAIDRLGVDAFAARVVAFEDQLSLDYPNLIVTWPQDALSAASDQAKSVQGKLTLLKFAVVTLLLAFVGLIAFRRRRDHADFRAALSRIGTPKQVLAWELSFEGSTPIILGGIAALLLSLLLPQFLSLFNFHVGFTDLFLGWRSLIALGAVLLTLHVGLTLSRDFAWRRAQLLCATLTLGFFLFYLSQSHVSDSRFLLIPFLYTGAPLLLSYLVLRGVQRFWRSRRPELFILQKEFFSLWLGVAATVALSVVLATISLGYNSGLSEQISEATRNQVPLDISLVTGSNLVRPLDLASSTEYSHLQPGSAIYPVLRTGTSIRGESSAADSLALIGIPAGALASVTPSLGTFAHSHSFNSTPPEGGIAVGGAQEITAFTSGIPKEVDLLGWFRTPRGTHISENFTGSGDIRTLHVTSSLPIGSSLVAFELRESSNYLSRRLHANGEGDYSIPQLKGVGSIAGISLDGAKTQFNDRVWGSREFPYLFDGQSLYLAPRRERSIPTVVTDPITASRAVHGNLTLLASGNTYMQVRVGHVLKIFPSAGERFVVMELGAMQEEIAQSNVGAIDPIELWVKSPRPETFLARLSASPLKTVAVKSRSALAKIARGDPNSVGLIASYRTALALALLIALLISLSAPRGVYREGRGALTHLEIVGYGPRSLRRALQMIWRTSIATGVLLGAALGVITSRGFISPSTPYLAITIALIGAYIIVEGLGLLLTRRFFRESATVA